MSNNLPTILPLVFSSLYQNSKIHWNRTIHNMVYDALKLFMDMNPPLFDQCTSNYRPQRQFERQRAKEREKAWEIIREDAKRNRGGDEPLPETYKLQQNYLSPESVATIEADQLIDCLPAALAEVSLQGQESEFDMMEGEEGDSLISDEHNHLQQQLSSQFNVNVNDDQHLHHDENGIPSDLIPAEAIYANNEEMDYRRNNNQNQYQDETTANSSLDDQQR